MITAAAAKTFLWLVLCLDGPACTDAQVYQIDHFEGPAAVFDCGDIADARAAELTASNLKQWRLGCATVEQFEKEGI